MSLFQKRSSQIPYGISTCPLQPQHLCEKLLHQAGIDYRPPLAYTVPKGLGLCLHQGVLPHRRPRMERIPFWKGDLSLGIQEGESHMLGGKRVARLMEENHRTTHVGRDLWRFPVQPPPPSPLKAGTIRAGYSGPWLVELSPFPGIKIPDHCGTLSSAFQNFTCCNLCSLHPILFCTPLTRDSSLQPPFR